MISSLPPLNWQSVSDRLRGPRNAFLICSRKGPETDANISSGVRPAIRRSKVDCRDPDSVSSGLENSNCESCILVIEPVILVICGAIKCVPASRSSPPKRFASSRPSVISSDPIPRSKPTWFSKWFETVNSPTSSL